MASVLVTRCKYRDATEHITWSSPKRRTRATIDLSHHYDTDLLAFDSTRNSSRIPTALDEATPDQTTFASSWMIRHVLCPAFWTPYSRSPTLRFQISHHKP